MSSGAFNTLANIHGRLSMPTISNIALSLGLASLFAERVIQTREDSDGKTISSWACKVVQMGAYNFTFFKDHGLPFLMVSNAMLIAGNYLFYRYDMPNRSPKGEISTLKGGMLFVYNHYKIMLSLVTGYWVDRSLQLTPKKGPVMAVVSIALLALSAKNVRYDVSNLPRQMNALLKITADNYDRIRGIEQQSICFVGGLAAGVMARKIINV